MEVDPTDSVERVAAGEECHPVGPLKKQHHVVTRGYLRHFADGERIRLVWKDASRSEVVGTKDIFRESGFSSAWVAGERVNVLEDEWARLESETLPGIRRIIAGDFNDALAVDVRVLMAIHLVRSYRVREMFDAITSTDEQVRAVTERMMKDPRGRQRYYKQYGKRITRDAVELLARRSLDDLIGGNRFFVDEQVRLYNTTLEDWLADWHVQVVRAVSWNYGFMTSDSPVIVTDKTWSRVHLALGDAGFVYMPLGRLVAVTMTTKPQAHAEVRPMMVQRLNCLMRRNCFRYLACHPADAWRRALALNPLQGG